MDRRETAFRRGMQARLMSPKGRNGKNQKGEAPGAGANKKNGNKSFESRAGNGISPNSPFVDCKERRQFFNCHYKYYAALFHEMGHSTGAKHRLDRNFKETKYAYEELIAELTAAFLCQKANIKITIENQAAYIASWLDALKNDKMLIITAASKAEKAAKYILNEEEGARKELKKCS